MLIESLVLLSFAIWKFKLVLGETKIEDRNRLPSFASGRPDIRNPNDLNCLHVYEQNWIESRA